MSVITILLFSKFGLDQQIIKDSILKRFPVIPFYLSIKIPGDSARDESLVTNPGRHANKQCEIFAYKNWTVSPQRRCREDIFRRSR